MDTINGILKYQTSNIVHFLCIRVALLCAFYEFTLLIKKNETWSSNVTYSKWIFFINFHGLH
jgi:hypothetical protein